ncbi:MAG: VanZ family protein [Treponema sp.]|nr:VanZ family protein [Treponema sp.]
MLKLPALVLAAGIWYLSSQPVLPQPKGLLGYDKFQHFLAYSALSAAIALWFSREKWRRGFRFPALTAALGSLYGLVDEIHQYFVPSRNCNMGDWFSDTLGALAAAAAVKLVFGRRVGWDGDKN